MRDRARSSPPPRTARSTFAAPAPADPEDHPRNADVCVVGAGVMGTWTAFWAQAGGAGPGEISRPC